LPSLSSVLDNVKPAPLAAVAAFVLGHLALKAWFFSLHYYTAVARPLEYATGGMITPISLAAAIEMAVLIGGIAFLLGGLHWRDVGLGSGGFVNACLVLLLLWGTVHVAMAAHSFSDCCSLELGPVVVTSTPVAAGRLLDAFWGSGFIEEVMYRGFLLPQVYLLARRAGVSAPNALVIALVGTQVYFGLNHIPAAMRMPMDLTAGAIYVAHAAMVGGLFAALYLRTGNLYVAIGAHALINNPAAIYVAGIDPSLLMLIGVCVLLLGWPLFNRVLGDVFTLAGARPPAEPATRLAT
jgi:uncharacterized protein